MSDSPQPLTHHLEEVRRRVLSSLLFFLFTSFCGYFFVDSLLNWLAKPVGEFVFTTPSEALFIRFKLAMSVGGIISFPYFLYQFWAFVRIALKDRESSILVSVVPISTFLFFMGGAIALFVVAPLAVRFLMSFSSTSLRPFISIDSYLSFLFWMIIGFGVLFQLPLIVVALVASGVLELSTIRSYRKHIVVLLVILSAFLTPGPDVVSQLVLFIPAYLLFEISLLVSTQFSRKL